jgi:CrcB protein
MSALHNLSALNFLAVGVGAALGAWMRWLLGVALNPLFIALPLGTLAANLIGGYLVGVAVGVFHLNTHFPIAWKLFAITGFLGGLTKSGVEHPPIKPRCRLAALLKSR